MKAKPDTNHLPIPAMTPKEKLAFRARVKHGEPGECWPFLSKRGQPAPPHVQFSFRHGHYVVSRIAWILANGPIPAGQFVRNTCGGSSCCNPAHLFISPHHVTPGRKPLPPRKVTAFTVADVRELMTLRGWTQAKLGREIEVGQSMVCRWIKRFRIPGPARILLRQLLDAARAESVNR